MRIPYNLSIDADPQQQEAAPPLVLVVRSFLRYTARKPAAVSDGPSTPVCGVGEPRRAPSLHFRLSHIAG
jgi:hypothetical protein